MPDMTYMPSLGAYGLPETGGAASATFTIPIPPPISNIATLNPLSVRPSQPQLYKAPSSGYIHVTKAIVTATAAQLVGLLQPLNWSTVAVDVGSATAGAGSITLVCDPGVYSTNYRNNGNSTITSVGGYSPPTFPNAPNVTDNAIAANDYVIYQGSDGTWFSDLVAAAAGSTTILVGLTAAMPAVKKGTMVFFYGIITDKDPATGYKRPQSTLAGSSARAEWPGVGSREIIASTYFPGDALLVYCGNTDQSMKLNGLSYFYSFR